MLAVVAALIERDGQILVCQRLAGARHELQWEFPGGKVEDGETPRDALRRELAEELGIDATIGREITRYEYQYPERSPILLIFFEVASYEGEVRNLAFTDMRWDTRQRLPQYDFLEGDRDFVGALARGEFLP